MARNLATLRKNIYIMLSHANKILALCYTVEAYRDNFENNKKYSFTSLTFFIIFL